MIRIRKISSLLFMTLLGLMSMHTIVPHVHHDHQVEDNHEVSHYHDHSASGHHHHDHSPQKGLKDLIDLFLAFHSHTVQERETSDWASKTQKVVVDQSLSDVEAVTVTVEILILDEEHPEVWWDAPPIYFDPGLSNSSLRGPPSLI